MKPFSTLTVNKSIRVCVLLILLCTSCKVSYVSFRQEQLVSRPDSNTVTRVYLDRYGDFYPTIGVPIDSAVFKLDGKSNDPNLASLRHYFLSDSNRLALLKKAYGISAIFSANEVYAEVQRRLLQNYVDEVKGKASAQHAGRIVYLVHGFNDTTAEAEYTRMRGLIAAKGFSADKAPVYVDVHWDGLNAHAFDGGPVVRVWGPALLDSRYVSITLRNLMRGVETSGIPSIVITHSLGGGVAMGALFNTTTKWSGLKMFVSLEDKQKLAELIRAPTPISSIRLGMLVPATPGVQTFRDFNAREPLPFDVSQNHIEKIIVGYNELDYGVGKIFLGKLRLAPIYGSTDLGCNFRDAFGKDEITKVFEEMYKIGYGTNTKLILPMEFKTALRPGKKSRQHLWRYYMDQPQINDLLDQLFND